MYHHHHHSPPPAPPSADTTLNTNANANTNAKVTTLCLFQFCFGYRSAIRPSGPDAIEAHTDIISAAVVVLASFLLIFLIIVVAFCLVQTLILTIHQRHSPLYPRPSIAAIRSRLIAFFDALNARCPLTSVAHLNDNQCSICLDHITPAGTNAVVRQLPCSHTFHANCIDRWFLQSRFLFSPSLTTDATRTAARMIGDVVMDKKGMVMPKCPVCNTPVLESLHLDGVKGARHRHGHGHGQECHGNRQPTTTTTPLSTVIQVRNDHNDDDVLIPILS